MILARAPLRLSFFGGGSDVPDFFTNNKSGGCVVSTTIDKFVYVAINKTPNNHIKVSYNDTEIVTDVNDLKHDRIREALKLYNIHSNIEISSFADIPSAGSGLGSSSSFTAALLLALREFKQKEFPDVDYNWPNLIDEVIKVEINLCKNNIGWQDQIATCFGGFNKINFYQDSKTSISIFSSDKFDLQSFQEHLLMFRIGKSRKAEEILTTGSSLNKHKLLEQITDIAEQTPILIKEKNYQKLGELLHRSWILKRDTNSLVSNSYVDEVYKIALEAGALGGKLCGAGSSGYLVFMALPEKQSDIITALKNFGLEKFDFTFSPEYARLLYSD